DRPEAGGRSLADIQGPGIDAIAVPSRVRRDGVSGQRDIKTIGKRLCLPIEEIQVDLQTFHPIERTITGSSELPEQPLSSSPGSGNLRLADAVIRDPQGITMEIFELTRLAQGFIADPIEERRIDADILGANQVSEELEECL